MGKRFVLEMARLDETYRWALDRETRLEPLTGAVSRLLPHPLVVIGSGGSLSAASYVASLHERHAYRLARPVTPLETLALTPPLVANAAVCLLSAGGRNPDILAAIDHILECEPRELLLLTMRPGSPLAARAASREEYSAVEYSLPSGKDGFLATNSLVATCTLLARAYADACSLPNGLPANLQELVHPGRQVEQFRQDLRDSLRDALSRENLVVLHGSLTAPAAQDLESKRTEAALGSTQLADYRNFAHGRHNWLDKHGHTSAILALSTGADESVAQKTLALIPDSVPTASIKVPHRGQAAGLSALCTVLYVVDEAGRELAVDPGRPRVANFGRALYRMRLPKQLQPSRALWDAAIERKTEATLADLEARGDLSFWHAAYDQFLASLNGARYRAVVLDYDGTLCGRRTRTAGTASPGIAAHLVRLLEAGVVIGIATGRGDSVRDDLRSFIEERYRQKVLVGHYNGGHLRWLHEDMGHPGAPKPGTAFSTLVTTLTEDPLVASSARMKANVAQLTLRPLALGPRAQMLGVVHYHIAALQPEARAVYSCHSVDVLAPGVGKCAVAAKLQTESKQPGAILRIGDRGKWPGNDHDLLAAPHALSVDEVSPVASTCWNIAPAGSRCVSAAIDYLSGLQADDGACSFSPQWLSRRTRR